MQCSVEWNDPNGMLLISRTGSGHIITMDGAPEGGGHNLSARPMELILSGAGGCSTYDIVVILKRGKQDIRRCTVNVTSERATTDPKVFSKIHFHFTVSGKNLEEHIVNRAIKLSHDKYCSAIAMLEKTASITYSVSIEEI